MEKVTLKINGEEDFEVNHPMVTIGRSADNTVSFPADANVSLYHARIEQREDGFWLIDQDSSNGTTLNDEKVDNEILLEDGDTILFGGTSQIVVGIEDEDAEDDEDSDDVTSAQVAEPQPAAKKNTGLYLMAGGVISLALVFTAVAGGVYLFSAPKKCEATARIISPDSGETLTEAVDVEIEVTNSQCVQKAVFMIGEKEFASAKSEPFQVSLDPKQLPDDLADGNTYGLKVVLIDAKGERISQSNEVALAFETLETKPKEPEIVETPPTNDPTPKPVQTTKVGISDTQTMVTGLLKQFSGKTSYKLDQQFLLEVNKKTAEYVAEGYFTKASQYRDTINVTYVQEQNLEAPLGYILAMSRSKFNPGKQADGEGLWRMSAQILTENGVNLSELCGTETLSDVSQKCSAKVSALYLKALVLNVFENDVIYSIAAIGMPPNEAAAFKATLPANREDFWKHLKSPKQREEVVKFFAAGIVAENPQKFGLKKDRPISELYKITMGN